MTAPDVEWDRFPITLRTEHLAEIFGMKADTVRRAIRHGDPSMPVPFMDKPWRWKKADVRRAYDRLTLRDVRQARVQLRRELRQIG